MRRPIPLAYAGLLIVALVAVVGFAAFSPSAVDAGEDNRTEAVEAPTSPVSARVASAILALRVSNADARLAETSSPSTPEAAPSTVTVGEPDVTTPSTDDPTATVAPNATPAPSVTVATVPSDTTPPDLHITSPSDGATVNDRVVTFEGTSEPGAEVSSGPYAAHIDENGNWSIKLVVSSEGSNARITAIDQAGNSVTESITVTYEAPAPLSTTTTTSPSSPPTTSAATIWSPLWPADAAGRRDVEYWRPLVEQYWPEYLVNCALNIIHLESWGNPQAYNRSASAEGLFQHLSKYWKGRAASAGFRDANGLYATPYNAEANIAVSWYLAKNSSPWDRHWSVDPQHPNAPYECTE
ncbi:MAG: hypothetical protein O3B42_00145 [Actinomycetota bacterium]|nr:hypothetical protein [Actinomycetota bacterium]